MSTGTPFETITFFRVRAVFERYGYSGSVASVLALLCTESPRTTVTYAGTKYEAATGPRGLPQGAPTSPGLSNQVARKLDKRLLGIASKLGLTYTRYADDITFSGSAELAGKIGWLLGDLTFESNGAIDIERQVRRELRVTALKR